MLLRSTTLLALALTSALLTGCGPDAASGPAPTPAVRILVAGDVMLGRGVGEVVATDPDSVFEGIRFPVRSADLAAANLESPLTTRPFAGTRPNDLRADPGAADLLADAGFDAMAVANNHAGDGGRAGVTDTVAALTAADLDPIGGGIDEEAAWAPLIVTVGNVAVGFLAFDATGLAPAATPDRPGIARWDPNRSPAAVRALRAAADVVVVSIHGGAEYLFTPDAGMAAIIATLAELDVDVVWGHGAHVVQPIEVLDPDGDGRPTVAASSLGNLVFDQHRPATDEGALLEVMAGPQGVAGFRIGRTRIDRGRVEFTGWELPGGAAALVGGAWWALATEPTPEPVASVDVARFDRGDLVAAARGDVDRDGEDELVVSFRRPWQPTALGRLLPSVQWQDAAGRSAHLGVFDPEDLESIWVASAMVRPVSDLVVCDGAIAVRYSALDDPGVTGAGAWTWTGFGWDEAPDLEGRRSIGCSDVDGDGRSDPVVGGVDD